MSFTCNFIKFLTRAPTINSARHLSRVAGLRTTNPPHNLPYFALSNNSWVWQKPEPFKLPISNIKPITLPDDLLRIPAIKEPTNSLFDKVIEDPLLIENDSKEAARLIVIRRKKMKKHKLKKFRKRMKYEHAKIRQRRELKKEKEFQAGLIARCKEAEAFSAEEFVLDKIRQATQEPPPRFTETPEYKELMRRKRLRLDLAK